LGGGFGYGKDRRLPMERAKRGEIPLHTLTMNAAAPMQLEAQKADAFFATDKRPQVGTPPSSAQTPRVPDLNQVTARQNLNETAFYFPQLVSDSNGVVRMTFTMPEALTEWKFMGFAHDRNLRSGFWEGKSVSSKDLMLQPNPPRFVREGDLIEFTVKVSNQSTNRQSGKVRLAFSNALTGELFDAALGVVGQASLSANSG